MKKDIPNKTSFGFKEVDENEKADLVGNVFDTVSKNYDLMNDLMSFLVIERTLLFVVVSSFHTCIG